MGNDQDPMPVFVIKAKDKLALRTLAAYQDFCTELGLDEQANEVGKASDEMVDWRSRNPDQVKLPDHMHVPVDGGSNA